MCVQRPLLVSFTYRLDRGHVHTHHGPEWTGVAQSFFQNDGLNNRLCS